jgi:hypothetical protein
MLSGAIKPPKVKVPKDPSRKVYPLPKDEALAEKSFKKGLKLFKTDSQGALKCFNDTIRAGSFRSRAFEKRADLLYREKRFYECSRDVDVVLTSPSLPGDVVGLLALKADSLLKLGCPKTALSFLEFSGKFFKRADVSKNETLQVLKMVARRRSELSTGLDETLNLRTLFPDREEMLRRVRRWTPRDGKKIGRATVSAALDLRGRGGDVDIVAARDIRAGV